MSMALASIDYTRSVRDIEACLAALATRTCYRLDLLIQEAVALCVLVAILRKRRSLDHSLRAMLQVLSVIPFEKIASNRLLSDSRDNPEMRTSPNQPILL